MAPQLRAGTVLAKSYRLLAPIGEGGMARVWAAEHLPLAREVAIKVIADEALRTPVARELFEREARATAAVDSPHVVRVLDFDFTEDGFPFLVLERLVGETLEARIARTGPLPLGEVATLVAQLGQGISAAHRRGILHRDIKAENVFLVRTRDGGIDVRLLDFGVAVSTAGRSLLTGTVGTVPYMSPEQLQARAVDERSNLFSLAVCVYYALTARLPFDASTLVELAVALSRPCPSARELRPELPRALDGWFVQALARDPSARFADADAACDAFAAAVEPPPGNRQTPLTVAVDMEEADLLPAGVPRRHGALRWLGAAATIAVVAWAGTHQERVARAARQAIATLPAAASPAPLEVADVRRDVRALGIVAPRPPARGITSSRSPPKAARARVAHAAFARAVDAGADADAPLPGPYEDETRGFGGRE